MSRGTPAAGGRGVSGEWQQNGRSGHSRTAPASGTPHGRWADVQHYEPLRAHPAPHGHGRLPAAAAPAVPRMRSPRSTFADGATPIYDSLYAEYRRLFRALPGDRTGEEELRFDFGTPSGAGTGTWSRQDAPVTPWRAPAWHVPALPPAPRHGHHH